MSQRQPDPVARLVPGQAPAGDATVARAILQTLAYGDIFDYPLTAREVHRYLIMVAASPGAVQSALENGRLAQQPLAHRQGFFTLPGRESIVETRIRRAEVAARIWPRARRYGLAIARLPFVRLVAVTGALAMDNVEHGDDIDYLIITRPGRLWLSRAIIIALVVKPAMRRGDEVCPNYFLSDRALLFHERNLFTAHELAQMVPIAGSATYGRMRQLNTWITYFLPNAGGLSPAAGVKPLSRPPVCRAAEIVLQTPLGAWLERWEMTRKIRRFSQPGRDQSAADFSADSCKGHFGNHGQQILESFAGRLQEIEAGDVAYAP
jgi:hypothetical protein